MSSKGGPARRRTRASNRRCSSSGGSGRRRTSPRRARIKPADFSALHAKAERATPASGATRARAASPAPAFPYLARQSSRAELPLVHRTAT